MTNSTKAGSGQRATRHNGRSGKNGVYNPKHNDRKFNLENSDHISSERAMDNVYWDCYRGYTIPQLPESMENSNFSFEDIEKAYYFDHYADHVMAQNDRNDKNRHSERNRTTDDLLKDKRTCPEETILQIGKMNHTVPPSVLAEIAAEYFDEFTRRYGQHVHIIDWALHLDEATPHIHERHVFDCQNRYGEVCPQQEKALEAMGVPLPDPDKKKGKYNNRKMTFDNECRKLFMDICQKHDICLETEPIYGGKKSMEKQDFIIEQQKAFIEEKENEIAMKENKLLSLNSELEDIDAFSKKIASTAYDKAVDSLSETITAKVYQETADMIDEHSDNIMFTRGYSSAVNGVIKKCFNELKSMLLNARDKVVSHVKTAMRKPETKDSNVSKLQPIVRMSVLDELARLKEESAKRDRERQASRIQSHKRNHDISL